MIDPTGALIVEIRDHLEDAGITDKVRGFEPAPGDSTKPYQRFVVIVALDVPPDGRLPITDARYAFRCYGTSPQDAFAVYVGLTQALHATGPRVKNSGLGIYNSWIETGGTAERDPDTHQPLVSGTIHLIATTQVVTA